MMNFSKSRILFEEDVWRTEVHHHTDFVKIGPSITRDIAIFFIFQKACHHRDFSCSRNFIG